MFTTLFSIDNKLYLNFTERVADSCEITDIFEIIQYKNAKPIPHFKSYYPVCVLRKINFLINKVLLNFAWNILHSHV